MGIRIARRPSELVLPFCPDYANHLGMWFAGIEFSLAEAASGHFLIERFPGLAGQVVPLLREAHIRFRRPSRTTLHALPGVSDEQVLPLKSRCSAKAGRRSWLMFASLKAMMAWWPRLAMSISNNVSKMIQDEQ